MDIAEGVEEPKNPSNSINPHPTPNEDPPSGGFIADNVPDVENPTDLSILNSTESDTPIEENKEREEEMNTFNEDHKSRFVESSIPPPPPTNF